MDQLVAECNVYGVDVRKISRELPESVSQPDLFKLMIERSLLIKKTEFAATGNRMKTAEIAELRKRVELLEAALKQAKGRNLTLERRLLRERTRSIGPIEEIDLTETE